MNIKVHYEEVANYVEKHYMIRLQLKRIDCNVTSLPSRARIYREFPEKCLQGFRVVDS